MTLGERVRALRRARDWTLSTLGSNAGVSVSYLNDIEHDRNAPSLKRLLAIASALGMSVTELLSGTHPYDHR